jgi:hypothetical protein
MFQPGTLKEAWKRQQAVQKVRQDVFLLGERSFLTMITVCLRQVSRRIGGTHENLKDCALVISD